MRKLFPQTLDAMNAPTIAPIHMAYGFLRSAARDPGRPALKVGNTEISYAQLRQAALDLAAIIAASDTGPGLTLVFAHKSFVAHAAVLGTLIAGRGYVPLNPAFPTSRNSAIISQSGARTMVVDSRCEESLKALLGNTSPMHIILPESDDVDQLRVAFPHHTFIGRHDIPLAPSLPPQLPDARDMVAYLLFTSGSTGTPKGVPVSHGNGCSFIRYATSAYSITANDRIAQTSDLTFDFSVQPMFMAWEAGACLCVVPEASLMAPTHYIRSNLITVWISVPSVIHFSAKLRLLKPAALPSVRLSLFCGEPLTAENAQAWQSATCNGRVINLYGPTEATVAITDYKWNMETSPRESEDGIVPIGHIFPGQRFRIVDEQLEPVAKGETGELLLAGSQVTCGYHNDPVRSASQYVRLDDEPEILWYRTGDLVRMDDRGCLYYKGRMDDQVQIRGYRVVLQEVAGVLKKTTGTSLAVVLAWPMKHGRAESLHCFIPESVPLDDADILEACRLMLPDYMVPATITRLEEFPLSPNGKIDRNILQALLEGAR